SAHPPQLAEAIRFEMAAIALRPHSAAVHNNLGVALDRNGRHDEAIAAYRKAITLQPDFAEAFSNLGVALQKKGRVDEAIASYQQAIRLKPDHAIACSNLASLLANAPDPKLRDPAEAVRLGRKAVQLLPDDAKGWQILGWAHYRNGAWKDSIEALNK